MGALRIAAPPFRRRGVGAESDRHGPDLRRSLAGIAILLLCFGLAIVKSELLPKWLGWVDFPLALIALIPPIGLIAWVGTGIWTLVVSIAIWRRLASGTAAALAVPASSQA